MVWKIVSIIISSILFIRLPVIADTSDAIGDLQVFPPDNPWNWDISGHEVHPNSDNFIASIGANTGFHPDFGTVWAGAPNGIPYRVIHNGEPLIPIEYTDYGDESDPGPFPIPLNAPIEGGPSGDGDRHVIIVDVDNKKLYELFNAFPQADRWKASSGAEFDLSIDDHHPETWTSADAAGLPIFPGLVRYEDVFIKKEINHALRFTVQNTQRKYIFPARHFASSSTDPNLPPMGLRFRLKADFDISGFSEPIQVILTALKKHGMMVADNGGDWFISGAPDDRWDDDMLRELKTINGSSLEALRTVDENGDPIYPVAIKHSNTTKNTGASLKIFSTGSVIKIKSSEIIEKLVITSLNGKAITTLTPLARKAAWNRIGDKGNRVESGIYLLKIWYKNSISTGRMVLFD